MTGIEHSEKFLAAAIAEAERGWGATHPNPMVGAVIVERGHIVAKGYHTRAGAPHAEVAALAALGRPPHPDAILYVTLEPCSTHGKTGACTEAILQAGIRHVVVGATDPNPLHAGRGLRLLQAAGVRVERGVLAEACTDLNLIFNHWIVKGTPLLAVKVATTLDACLATRNGDSQWITGPEARTDVMRWRRYFPAIAVGAGTVIADNPQLTSRLGESVFCPRRIVLDRSLRSVTAPFRQVYADACAAETIVVTAETADPEPLKRLRGLGVEVWQLPTGAANFWALFKQKCAAAGICGVYIETGPTLLRSLLHHSAVDYLFHYQAPRLLADSEAAQAFSGRVTEKLADALQLHSVRRQVFGEDGLTRGYVGEG